MKYLIYTGPGIGDLMMQLPVARRLRENDKNAKIYLFANMGGKNDYGRINSVRELMAIQDLINGYFYYSSKDIPNTLKWILKLKAQHIDYGFVQQADIGNKTSMYPCKIINFIAKKTIGYVCQGNSKIHYDIELPGGTVLGNVNRYMNILDSLGYNQLVSYEKLLDIQRLVEKVKIKFNFKLCNTRKITIVVGSAALSAVINGRKIEKFTKNWNFCRWGQLAELFSNNGFEVFLLGGKQERKEFEIVNLNMKNHNHIHNFIGQCSIIDSLWIVSNCDLVIGSDTGLLHCASALNTASLTLFWCTDPKEFLAYGDKSYYIFTHEECSPCYPTDRMVLCEDVKCMNNISVEKVFRKSIEILSE